MADRLGDAAIAARVARAVANALVVSADPETDGSWKVSLAVPIEAVRQALAGPRALDADGDRGPAVMIVEGLGAKPAVGALPAATLWVKDVPAWAKGAPRAKAPAGGGLPAKGTAATLYLVVR